MQQEHLEMILEDMSGKFDLVLEGQESLRQEMHSIRNDLAKKIETNSFKIDVLNNKIDGVEEKLTEKIDSVEERLSRKIDGVAADLSAHRRDTEVHLGYHVKE